MQYYKWPVVEIDQQSVSQLVCEASSVSHSIKLVCNDSITLNIVKSVTLTPLMLWCDLAGSPTGLMEKNGSDILGLFHHFTRVPPQCAVSAHGE